MRGFTYVLFLFAILRMQRIIFFNIYAVTLKRIPNIIHFNLKKDYQLLLILGVNILGTTGHQMTV